MYDMYAYPQVHGLESSFSEETHTDIRTHTHIYIHILDFVIYIRPRLDTRECMVPNMWFHPSQPPWFLGGEAVFSMNCGWDNDLSKPVCLTGSKYIEFWGVFNNQTLGFYGV